MTRKGITNKKLIVTLEAAGGLISVAAKKMGIDRGTLYNWIRKDKELQEALANIKESLLDFTESKLLGNIKAGDNAAICFYLKCQGKARGYTERPIVVNANSQHVNVNFSASQNKYLESKTQHNQVAEAINEVMALLEYDEDAHDSHH